MKIYKISSQILIAYLMLSGLNLRTFAEKYGYTYSAVKQVVFRYAGKGKPANEPYGPKTLSILENLEKHIPENLRRTKRKRLRRDLT